ncbi:MAG: hypothetical protein Q4B70_18735 [Lachnospiraceae bacterium]|nr:hypothetical protein [Lachnospiraceae bacterium]
MNIFMFVYYENNRVYCDTDRYGHVCQMDYIFYDYEIASNKWINYGWDCGMEGEWDQLEYPK